MSEENKQLEELISAEDKNSPKCGIVIVYHNHVQDFVKPCLDSVLEFTPQPRYIVALDNESVEEDAINLALNYAGLDIEFIRIDKQLENGGLSGAWNQGIKKCLENGCERIILLNHDTVVDGSWPIFINKIEDDNYSYGPLSNNPGIWSKQKNTKDYSLLNRDNFTIVEVINGFCLGFTKNCLVNNKLNGEDYFNPLYPFGGNEIEWHKRFRLRGGRSKIIEGGYVFHHKDRAWKKIKLLNKQKKNCPDRRGRMVGLAGVALKKILPSIYKTLKPYFPDKK